MLFKVPVWHELNSDEDKELIRSCQAGDEKAFEVLVAKYQRELFHLVSWHVGTHADVEDIVQEIFCKIYFSLRRFDNDRPLYPWLRRVAINQCYDELRRQRRRKILKFTELNEQETRALDRLIAGNEQAAAGRAAENGDDIRVMMQKILDKLPERQRMVIVLRDFKQVPYEEMAEIMKCSKQAVRLKVFRARARLRTLLLRALRRQENLSHANLGAIAREFRLTTQEAEA